MAYKIVASLWLDGQVASYHLFTVPQYGEPGFYNTIRTYEGFRHREAKGLAKWHDAFIAGKKTTNHPPKRAHLTDFDDKMTLWEMTNIPERMIFHEDIYAFFRHIGYDNKKKKYIK